MSTSLDESICAYFVNNVKSETEADLAIAEQYANALKLMREQLADTQIREIRASEGFPLIAGGGLTKKDIFVLARFEGDLFQQLQLTKALVLGPPCIVECLRQNEPVPLGSSPIYTTAMRELQISASGISSKEKDELKKLIHWMGGHYFQNFGRNITHLISNTIKSNKYEHATLNDVPVMHVDWVQRVWECSHSGSKSSSSIRATDQQFDKYRLPTFFGANITCSGLETAKKDAVMRLVNENGGIYHRAFRSQQVDIVITEQSKTDSDKYKAAVRFKKDILLPEWIFDSHERGYALPTKQYEVRPRKQISTPTKQHAHLNAADNTQLSDLSRISFVSAPGRRMCSDNTTVNETLSSNCSTSSGTGRVTRSGSGSHLPAKQLLKQATAGSSSSHKQQPYQQTLAEISPRKAKQAGNFLDGCCIYLSGFRNAEREKLHRVLNTGGATRYDDPHEGLTHIVVGQLEDSAHRQWQSEGLLPTVQVVRLEWLLESMRAGHLVSELPHRVHLPHACEAADAASPASKRTLRSMNHSFKQPTLPIKKKLFEHAEAQLQPEPDPEPDLLTHYSQEQEPAMPLPAASSTQLSLTALTAAPSAAARPSALPVALPDLSASTLSIDFDKLDYLMGASVYVHEACFSSELYDQMLSECKAAQGCLVPPSYTDPVDYAIVSFEQVFDESVLPVSARHVVTELYLESCMKQNKLLPLEYYHRPVPYGARLEPLRGMTIVVSIYAGLERDYINALAELLGAVLNKAFVKKERPLLICSSAEGSKYEGALKWGYPVVHADWLLQCAQRGEKLPYVRFLVGKSASDFPASPGLREGNKSSSSSSKTLTPKSNTPTTPLNKSSAEQQQQQQQQQQTLREEDKEQQPHQPDLTPLRNPRISELVTGLASTRRRSSGGATTPESPHTPLNHKTSAGGGACNFDFLEQVVQRLDTSQARDCVRQIIREMRENQTPELERIRRQACTPVNRRQTTRPAPGIPNFCLTPEFQQRMADDFERRWRLPKHQIKPDTPLTVIRQRVMRITCETLGINYNAAESGESVDEEEEAHHQKSRGAMEPPVGRLLFQPEPARNTTAVAGAAASGSPFVPSTQSPRTASEELPSGSTINFDKISFEETTNNSMELKQITDYLKSRESRRSSLKRDHEGQTRSEAQYVQPFESEGFALTAGEDIVGWRDPAEFNGGKRSSDADSPRMRYQGTPCFSISCGDDEQKRMLLMERIRLLGGQICQNLSNYDAACTHLLCERPNRGEKLLGCMAAGKWVLNINYIEDCHARGAFLDECLYEWGNPKALNLPTLAPEEQQIAVAAHRWRTELIPGTGAFSDHCVILSLQERNLAAIKNVLRAGGATILEPSSPFSSDATAASATHCFVDIKKAPLDAQDFAYLQQRGVRIMSQMCINSYLMGGRDTNLEKYVLRQ
ncbi:DNA topoisomerase 2-binding protein 1 [Drosophila virilis]|uniref:BRCT domain-containing protein n=1 Tax=Drosophila virilis TaxID=7244 RepID=B4M2P3_DROVI|nr:DNA topoisomerase 2-binding protein 1-A [Drosophila virilis]EDW65947.1 uncharacterized protein Dvir_GJ18611 [Drosophila virilis]